MRENLDQSEISLVSQKEAPIVVNDIELFKFRALFSLITVIIGKQDHQVKYESGMYTHEFAKYGKDTVAQIIDKKFCDNNGYTFNFSLVFGGIRTDYSIVIKDVIMHEQEAYLGIIQELAHYSASQSTDEKISRISSALLQINSTVDIGADISKTLDLVLTESIKSFEYGHYGTMFLIQGDHFKLISNIGYSDEIYEFRLPITDSFLYVATQGKMDRVILINELQNHYKVTPIKTITGDISDIKSTIVAPIFYRGSLYGMMSIDSTKQDAFTQDDLAIMTFIRDNVQVIISNQLNFLERTNQALTDNMTGLYNRHFLIEHLNSILERAKRYDERFSVLVFDLDDLKLINDRYGHLVGDQLIKSFANTLQHNMRRSDILARFGGDEFVAVLLSDNETEIIKRIEKLKHHLTYKIDDKTTIDMDYHCSYGLALYPRDGSNYADLINVADARMYQLKTENKAKRKQG